MGKCYIFFLNTPRPLTPPPRGILFKAQSRKQQCFTPFTYSHNLLAQPYFLLLLFLLFLFRQCHLRPTCLPSIGPTVQSVGPTLRSEGSTVRSVWPTVSSEGPTVRSSTEIMYEHQHKSLLLLAYVICI